MRKAGIVSKKFFLLVVGGLSAVLAQTSSLHAFSEERYDVGLLRQLIRLEMYAYATIQVTLMERRYPERSELITIEKAKLFYAQGRRNDSDALMAQINVGSSHYIGAQLAMANLAFEKGDAARSSTYYAKFFQGRDRPLTNAAEDIESFRQAVYRYSRALQRDNRSAEAARVLELLRNAGGEAAGTERELTFMQAKTVIDGQANVEPSQINQAVLRKAISDLGELQWEIDAISALSMVEQAHAHVLLQEYDKALSIIGGGTQIFGQIHEALVEAGQAAASPRAGALFYEAKAMTGKAQQALRANKREDARENLIGAVRRFFVISQEIADSPLNGPAFVEFSKVAEMLKTEFNLTVEPPRGVNTNMAQWRSSMEQADAHFGQGNFAQAAPLYLRALQRMRNRNEAAESGFRLIICYGRGGKFLEAQVIASFLAEAHPKHENSIQAVLALGAMIYQKGREAEAKAAQEAYYAQAIAVWENFLRMAPGHPRAAGIAFTIAENQYRLGIEAVRASQALREPRAIEEQRALARQRFADAVPLYQRVINSYRADQNGVRSYYKLAWVYYNIDSREEAAEAFLRYSELETLPERAEDRLEAKFRAAEQLMLGRNPQKAIPHFQELQQWLSPDNKHGFATETDKAKQMREDATSYVAWSYDLFAETFRQQITTARSEMREATQRIAVNQRRIGELQQIEQATTASIQQAKDEFVRQRQGVLEATTTNVELDRALARAAGIGLEATDEAERQQEMRNARDLANRLLAGMRDREQDRIFGQKMGYQQQQNQIRARAQNAAARLEQLRKRQHDQQLELTALETRLATISERRDEEVGLFTGVEEKIATATADITRLRQMVETINTILRDETRSDDDKQRAQNMRQQAITQLQTAMQTLTASQEEHRQLSTPNYAQRRENLIAEFEQLTAQVATAKSVLAELMQNLQLVERENALYTSQQAAITLALELVALEEQNLVAEDTAALTEKITQAKNTLVSAFEKAQEKHIELEVFRKTQAQEEMAIRKAEIAGAEQKRHQLEQSILPVQEEFRARKRDAETHFSVFLERYPKSTQVPDNMARLGTIYIEFEQYDKAAKYLNDLATRFPDNKAVAQALFNLGRAQFEIQQFDEAEATLTQLLNKSPDDQSSANLNFISMRMLEAGKPAVSLQATNVILQRSENPNHPDYDSLRANTLEGALFRAGQANLALDNHEQAIHFLNRVLELKPNSGYFFDIKFAVGKAKANMSRPDIQGAVDTFDEVMRFATDQHYVNRALCEGAAAFALDGTQPMLRRAVARYQQVIMLADPNLPANQPWIELAYYESAKLFARLGNAQRRDDMIDQYLQKYPRGTYRQQINNMPPAEFSMPAPAAPAASSTATR